MLITVLAAISALLAVLPALLYWWNIWLYRRAPTADEHASPVSVLIPARNEESSITAALEAVLASRDIEFEVLVLDDHSEDRTRENVASIAAKHPCVRLIESAPLPEGWCGKQFACHQLAQHARHDLLLFADADVRLAPDALTRLATFQRCSDADLVSGVPRQETGTLLERLLIPLIHFLLLGYLPIFAMRRSRLPGLGAGCGQLFLARREPYEAAGGHAAIRSSRHDGITLPRAFRRAGFKTDLCDVTDLAVCRMYRSAPEVLRGLSKNAREGLASPAAIVPWTLILLGGQVAPFVLLPFEPISAGIAIAAAYSMRFDAARRFAQSWLGAALHPIGVLLLVAIQWYALVRDAIGRPVGWKGR